MFFSEQNDVSDTFRRVRQNLYFRAWRHVFYFQSQRKEMQINIVKIWFKYFSSLLRIKWFRSFSRITMSHQWTASQPYRLNTNTDCDLMTDAWKDQTTRRQTELCRSSCGSGSVGGGGEGRGGRGGGGALQSHLVRADHQSSLSVSHLLITPAVIPAHSECDAAVVLQHTVQTPVLLSDWITLPVTWPQSSAVSGPPAYITLHISDTEGGGSYTWLSRAGSDQSIQFWFNISSVWDEWITTLMLCGKNDDCKL